MGSTQPYCDRATVLPDDAVNELERLAGDGSRDWSDAIGLIRRLVAAGVSDGSFSEAEAMSDMYISLSISRACRMRSDYDSFLMSARFLEPLEGSAGACGEWYGRYAEAMLFTGRPNLAREYLERGVSADPGCMELWCSLVRVRAGLGDPAGAAEALSMLEALDPPEDVLGRLEDVVSSGIPIEDAVMDDSVGYGGGPLCDRADHGFDRTCRSEAAKGILVDREGLESVKAAMGIRGWMPDHPYCTSMLDIGQSSVILTLEMDEASVSKLDPARARYIVAALESMDRDARERLSPRTEGRPVSLSKVDIHSDLSVTLGYASGSMDEDLSVSFDSDLEPVRDMSGGPFGAMVLLEGDGYDPGRIIGDMGDAWGIALAGTEIDGGSVAAAVGSHLLLIRHVDCPVPAAEIGSAAEDNYTWPDASSEASRHRSHLIVVLVNHGGSAVDGCRDFLKILDSCVRCTDCVGVYMNDVVYRPDQVTGAMEAFKRSGETPLPLMVWVSLFRDGDLISARTSGLRLLARRELEVHGLAEDPGYVMQMMYSIAGLEIDGNYELSEGDRFRYSDDMEVSVSRMDDERLRLICRRLRSRAPVRKRWEGCAVRGMRHPPRRPEDSRRQSVQDVRSAEHVLRKTHRRRGQVHACGRSRAHRALRGVLGDGSLRGPQVRRRPQAVLQGPLSEQMHTRALVRRDIRIQADDRRLSDRIRQHRRSPGGDAPDTSGEKEGGPETGRGHRDRAGLVQEQRVVQALPRMGRQGARGRYEGRGLRYGRCDIEEAGFHSGGQRGPPRYEDVIA